MIEADIREDGTCAEMCLVTENRVTDIVEMGDLRLVKDEAVLEFAGVAQHNAIPDDNIFTDVGTVADFASFSDPGWPLDHGAMLDHRPSSDENRAADEGLADQLAIDAWLEAELEVSADLGQGLPGMGDIIKNESVLGMVEIEKGVSGKHGDNNFYMQDSQGRRR